MELNSNNFSERRLLKDTTNGKSALVLFYSPNCGHCVKYKPEFEKTRGIGQVDIFTVDVTKNSDLGKRFEISSVPTVFYFFNGHATSQFSGYKTHRETIQFLCNNLESACEYLNV